MAAACIGAGDHGGDAHIKEGVGLALRVHAGKAIDQAGDEEFSSAIDDARIFRDGDVGAGADGGDAAAIDNDNRIGQIVSGATPVGDVYERSAHKNQGGRLRGRWGSDLRDWLRPGKNSG